MKSWVIAFCWAAIAAAPVFAEIGEIDVNAGPPAQTAPADESHAALWLHAKTRVTALMTDPAGHRTGVDPVTHRLLQEIPNSTAEVDYIANQYTGDARAEADERFSIEPAQGGLYQLQLSGLQEGPYEVTVSALAKNGSSEPSKEIEGLVSEGETKNIQLRFDPSPNAVLSVVDVQKQKS